MSWKELVLLRREPRFSQTLMQLLDLSPAVVPAKGLWELLSEAIQPLLNFRRGVGSGCLLPKQ